MRIAVASPDQPGFVALGISPRPMEEVLHDWLMGSISCSRIGVQLGYIFRLDELQGYFNLKCYEPSWIVWLTFVLTPVPPTPTARDCADETHVAERLPRDALALIP